ncbi:hypothetical protein ACTMTI_34245 [Nonomuraea sp. H19]|uniref:hypothetical protein n=1 Tax=Nonomuraea sp. H19 TaxID=3452206 RepID=UPI003F8AD617
MTNHPHEQGDQPVERGGSEETSGAPLTPTEEETSRRPASTTPGATPDEDMDDDDLEEGEALYPDDLE